MNTTEKIELIKWFLASVVLVVIPMIINYGLDERKQGIEEFEKYDKFATELLLTNNSIGKRRIVAQYFSYVIPSEKLRKPWERYYKMLDSQYRAIHEKDSILLERISGNTRMAETSVLTESSNLSIKPETESSKRAFIDPDMERMLREHEENLKQLDENIYLPKR